MKKPTDITTNKTDIDLVTPSINYLEGLNKIDPELVKVFFEDSRLKQLHIQNFEVEELKFNHQLSMKPHENRALEIKIGFAALVSVLGFIAYLVTINRADIAGFAAVITALALLIGKFIAKK